jgi:hypothetical protein
VEDLLRLDRISDFLSVISFVVALWAGLRVRTLTRAFQDLIRGEDLLDRLRSIASGISSGASDTDANRDDILLLFVNADATLEGLKGRIGGWWFVFWGRRYTLKSEMDAVRRDLDRYQEGGRTLDGAAVMGEYRKIQRVAEKVANLMQDRRLER